MHVESCTHLHRSLSRIRELGAEAGVAINPATSLSLISDAVQLVDFVLVMSVNPGFGGQSFIPSSLDRIRRLRQMLTGRGQDIAVDGGVDEGNARALVEAGASVLVAGSAIFGSEDRAQAVQDLRRVTTGGDPS